MLAFMCNFVLLGSYYILRPVRDAMATVFGAAHLQELFTGTLVLTIVCAPLFAWVTDSFKLSRVLPGVFWFPIANFAAFDLCFQVSPESRWLAAAFFWWLSVVSLFMISVFWSLLVDVFTPSQATRLLSAIAGGFRELKVCGKRRAGSADSAHSFDRCGSCVGVGSRGRGGRGPLAGSRDPGRR